MTDQPLHDVYVFDAYGTLFDVSAAAARHKHEIGDRWQRLAELWRVKQLEYTWVLAAAGKHAHFSSVTSEALSFAVASVGGVPPGVEDKLRAAYRTLDAYPEVGKVLADLKARGAVLAILSNGDSAMLADAVAAAGLVDMFDAVISVEEVGIFKPSPRVYARVTARFGVTPQDVSFQSSNRWDIAGAAMFGFDTVWVNRSGAPDEYPEYPPTRVVHDLAALMTPKLQS